MKKNMIVFNNIKIENLELLNLNLITDEEYDNEELNYVLVDIDTILDFEERRYDYNGEYIRIAYTDNEEDKMAFENMQFECWISDLTMLEELLLEIK